MKIKLSPEFYTEKVAECKQFYCDYLGFKVEMELEGFVVLRHAESPEYEILFCVPDSPFVNKIFRPAFKTSQGFIFQLEVDDVESVYKRLKKQGVEVALDLIDEEINGHHFTVKDPNDVLIDIVQFK